MDGHRSSRAHRLRLVSPAEHLDGRPADHRPVVLHALGTPRETMLLSPVITELERLDCVRQVLVGAPAGIDVGALEGIDGLHLPDRHLGLGEGTATEQFAAMLAGFEMVLDVEDPELVVVAGSTDAALACALAAAKRGVALAHVESGLRKTAPGALAFNRILVDRLADTLLAPSAADAANLLAEGIPDTRVHVVGDTAIDLVRRLAPAALARRTWAVAGLPEHGYVLVDLVDDGHLSPDALLQALLRLSVHAPVALRARPELPGGPPSPDAVAALGRRGITCFSGDGLIDRLSLLGSAGAVVTNVGTVQDEAAALGVACHTVGAESERPATVSIGANVVLGEDLAAIADVRPTGLLPIPNVLAPWDGRAAARVGRTLVAHYVLAVNHPSAARS
jgi:UDP-N-acetylglucosamine 2-epimerase (non-hydrolysing)